MSAAASAPAKKQVFCIRVCASFSSSHAVSSTSVACMVSAAVGEKAKCSGREKSATAGVSFPTLVFQLWRLY